MKKMKFALLFLFLVSIFLGVYDPWLGVVSFWFLVFGFLVGHYSKNQQVITKYTHYDTDK